MSAPPSRRQRRRAGSKRQQRREAHEAVERVIVLSRRGIGPAAIAASVGLTVDLVEEILAYAAEVEEANQGEGDT